jgi:hypothetical protein
MAIIYSYPQAIPKDSDLIIGTVTYDPNDPAPVRGNPTRSFRVSDLAASITGNSYTLTSKALGANSSIVLTDNTGFIAGTVNFNSGSGISVLNSGNTITITNTGVLSNIAGTGISLSGTTGNVTITNSGVTGIAITDTTFVDLSLSSATGNVTLTAALSATGTPGNSNYLRGDNQWFTPVTTINTTDGTYINLTPNTAATGTVTVTADLSATGSASNQTFLRGDNVWATPGGGGTVIGTGTAGKITKWTATSEVGDSIMTEIATTISVAGNISTQGAEINKSLTDGAGNNGTDGQLLSSTTVNGDKEIAWIDAPASGVVTINTNTPNQLGVTNGSGPTTTLDIAIQSITGSGTTALATGADIVSYIAGLGYGVVDSVTSGDVNTITIGGTTADPTVAANTAAVVAAGTNLATGGDIVTYVTTNINNRIQNIVDPTSAQDAATKNYVDQNIVGSLAFQGGYNASTNTPDLTSSPNSIKKGWTYAVTVAGDASGFWNPALNIGDLVIANIDNPTSISDWTEVQGNIDVATDTVKGIASFPTAGGLSVSTGEVSLPNTGVTAASYTAPFLTIDAKGRITSATDNPGAGTVTSVALAAPSAFTVTGSPVTNSGTLTLSGAGTNAQFIDGTGSLQSTLALNPTLGLVTDGSNVDMRLEAQGLLLSTVQFTAGSAMEITQSGGNDMTINLNNSGVTAGTYFAPSITVDSKGRITSATPTSTITGGGTIGKIPVFSATNSVSDSIMTETTGLITTAGSIKPTSITDTNNSIGTAGQILSSTGSAIDWIDNTGEGYDLNATTDGNNVDLNLTSTSGTDDSTVQFTAGSNMTITQAGGNNITLASEEINEIIVTVQNVGGNNKYFIDGAQQISLELVAGITYRLDQSDSSNSTHPLRFSTNADNTPSAPYTTGVTVVGTPGSAGAYTQIILEQDTPKLYYYCTNHSGMGGEVIDPRATSADSFTATSGTFINFTPTTIQTGAVTLTGDLSATGTADNTTFLRGDNQWVTVAGTTYDYSSAQSGNNVNLNLIPSTGTTDTVTLVAGSNITLTDNGSNNVTVAASTSGGGTIEKNDFTGTGSQTQFILTTAPASILFTDVYINGVYQEKETYSVTGTSLDFTTAPPLNVSIEVMSIIVSNLLPGANTLTTNDFTGTGSQTDFTLSTAPPNIDFTSVYVSGVYQQKGQAYTVSGTTLTFTEAPDLNDTIEVVIISSASLVNTAPANYNVSVISSSANASKNTLYVLKANLTLTLPGSPDAGDSIKISNLSGVATCVVARNGNNIMATATDLTLDNAVASFELVYTDATNGWVIIGPQ